MCSSIVFPAVASILASPRLKPSYICQAPAEGLRKLHCPSAGDGDAWMYGAVPGVGTGFKTGLRV